MENKEVFICNLIIFRRRRRLSQEVLAWKIGMLYSTYLALEAGKLPEDIDIYVKRISKILKVPLEKLYKKKKKFISFNPRFIKRLFVCNNNM